MITRLLNVALNRFSKVSVPAPRSRRAEGAERDSEYDRARGGNYETIKETLLLLLASHRILSVNVSPF